MSYSFSVRAASKAGAIAAVGIKMDEVVVSQPVHSDDMEPAMNTAKAFIGLLESDETQDVAVSMNGSIWRAETGIRSTAVTVNANLVNKEKPV